MSLPLPTEPGTVIAIGEWWLVRLRSHDGAPTAWELLSLPSKGLPHHRARARDDLGAQRVYGDKWVLAEAEREGQYIVIAEPVRQQWGVKYFRAGDPS